MTNAKSPTVVTIQLGARLRWLLLLPALLAILGAWFAVRWYVGNTIAEYAPGVADGGVEMARMAVRWAPGDPLTHWRLGISEEATFSADNIAAAVREYQTAVALSPNDYRYWMELGRALEAGGDRENGEKALRRAVELAPAYSHPRWHFGNLLLREGKFDAAFDQLGHAAEADDQMRPQVFGLAMRVFDGDVNQIAKVACQTTGARMQFAVYLVGVGTFDDAARILSTISPVDRRAQTELSRQLQQSLLEAKQFHAVLKLMRENDPDTTWPTPEQFWNGGFESDLTPPGPNAFGWVTESRGAAQVSIDGRAHSGQKSLRIIFRAPRSLEKISVSQTVVVEPGAQYRVEFYVRTEDIISASTPAVIIFDAADGATLASSRPLPTGTSDWQKVTIDFTEPPGHEGIRLGFYRGPCGGDAQICPIFGTAWYDDFNLQRISGPGAPRRGGDSRQR